MILLGGAVMQFAGVERVPRYNEVSRENDAELSFMLSLVATEVCAQFFPSLDAGLVARFANAHGLIELETGDVATFALNDSQLATKQQTEHAALEKLIATLPTHTADLLRRYEAQTEPEARLVRLVDKKLPVEVDILGPGKKVMNEDYAIFTDEQLRDTESRTSERLRRMFPEPEFAFLHDARYMLADHFSYVFTRKEPALAEASM